MSQRYVTQVAEASASASTRSNTSQAEPLPRKVGELGYNSAIHGSSSPVSGTSSDSIPLAPHPAERTERTDSNSEAISATSPRALSHSRTDTSSTASSESTTERVTPQAVQSSTSLAPSATSMSSISRLTKKFKPSPKPSKHLFGMAPRTLCKFFVLIFILIGVCAGWALATKANADGHGTLFGGGGMNVVVFIHVAFSVIVITQLLFIERTVFRLRAERFSYLHPEAELPTRNPFTGGGNSHGLAFAPWQRPSLPSYAAALRAAPTTTGDAEDQEVARMVALGRGDVPPIYGNTRGSTLLAYGLGAGPLANRPTSSSSRRTLASLFTRREAEEVGSRPVSYGQSQQIEDALRAQKLEETLTRLEAGN